MKNERRVHCQNFIMNFDGGDCKKNFLPASPRPSINLYCVLWRVYKQNVE